MPGWDVRSFSPMFRPPVHLNVYPIVLAELCPPIRPSVYPSICLTACPPASLSAHPAGLPARPSLLSCARVSPESVVDGGDLIISEDEFNEINHLKQLKLSYREAFEKVRVLRAEMQYCEKLVEQSRQKLIQGTVLLCVVQCGGT